MRFSSFLLLLILTGYSWSAPHEAVHSKHESLVYLNKYGYNNCSNSSKSVACIVDHSLTLRNFQQWYGLKRTGVLDASTIRQMNRPRCGNSDIQLLKLVINKWSRSSLTWSLRSYPRQIEKKQAKAIIREAFNAWLAYIPLQIKEACSACSADMVLDFKRHRHNCNGGSFDGRGGTLAHASFPEGGKIHFDADEPWTEKFDNSGINFYLVAVHEIGHALGLRHNNDRGSIMYPDYQLFPRGSMLPNYDRRSIQSLYGWSNGSGGRKPTCNCPSGQCCSKQGFCGTSEEYCGENCTAGSCWFGNNDVDVDESEPMCNFPPANAAQNGIIVGLQKSIAMRIV